MYGKQEHQNGTDVSEEQKGLLCVAAAVYGSVRCSSGTCVRRGSMGSQMLGSGGVVDVFWPPCDAGL